jgi:hypothetical protein
VIPPIDLLPILSRWHQDARYRDRQLLGRRATASKVEELFGRCSQEVATSSLDPDSQETRLADPDLDPDPSAQEERRPVRLKKRQKVAVNRDHDVTMTQGDDKVYDIEEILDGRVNEEMVCIEYLMKWVGYDATFNEWRPSNDFVSIAEVLFCGSAK